jgi:hypothetical protein
MIEKRLDVLLEEREEHVGDLVLVCQLSRPGKRDPGGPSPKRNERYSVTAGGGGGMRVQQTHQTPLRCIAPTLTTTRSFSFLRMPSRLPLES